MKKLLTILALFIPTLTFGQYVMYSNHYPADSVANMILKGKLTKYCSDTIEFVIDKDIDKQKSRYISAKSAQHQLLKICSMGSCEYGGRTNGGYSFSIYVLDKRDEMKIVKIISFKVNRETNKIETIIFST